MPTPETDILTRDKFLNTLAESYVLHETILNSTELAVISSNPDGIITSMNTAAEKLLGYDPEELIGKQSFLLLHLEEELNARAKNLRDETGDDLKGVDILLAQLRKGKTSERREWTYQTKGRQNIPVSVSLSAIKNEKGDLTGFLSIATDIREQRKADEELRRSRNHLQALIQSLDDIAFEVDQAGNYLNVWTSREDLLFAKKDFYPGRNISDIISPALTEIYERAIPRVMSTGTPESFEHPSIKPGSDQWYSAKITRLASDRVLILVREITEQKKSELALLASERKFRLLTENVPGVIYLCRNDAKYSNVFVSKNIEKITGYPSIEFLGAMDIMQVVHPDDREFVHKDFEDALAQRRSYSLEYRVIHKSGEVKWVKETGAGLFGDHGLELIEGYISDITKRKQAEIALQESEQKFRLLAENIPGVIYLCNNDANYTIVYLNHNVEQLTGYTADEFLAGAITFVDLYHPDDTEAIFNAVNDALEKKIRFHLEYRLRHKDQSWRWVEEVGEGVYRDGNLHHLEGFLRDVTEQKKADHEMRTVANENFRIFNYSPCLQAVVGLDGKFKRVNPIWEKTLGWSVEELLTTGPLELLHDDDKQSALALREGLIGGTAMTSFECRYRCKDGSYRWVMWSASIDTESKLINATGLDITERKKSEEALLLSKNNLEVAARELQEQNRQQSEFAHIISHNLRSPARNIEALISLVNENSSKEEYNEVFRNLRKTSHNLAETLDELLDILRVKKAAAMEQTGITFEEVLSKVKQDLLGEIITSNATITFDFSSCPSIVYYKPYLESIFLNLLSNALKYRFPQRNPEVIFRTSDRNGRCFLEVTDNGLGIDLDRYGEHLFGLHKVFTDHKQSRGVGLFLTRTQIEAMGGRIWAESKVGVGSSFFVSF
jgi:PAS domain S-box-containing protein